MDNPAFSTPPSDNPTPPMLKQIGALPVEKGRDGRLSVILITTRDSGRWSIPKGNPIKGLTRPEAAALEAFEEGGLIGKMSKRPVGKYLFWKRRSGHWELAEVAVYRMDVERRADDFKERGLRQIQNFSFEDAEDAIVEPGLKQIIRQIGEDLGRKRG